MTKFKLEASPVKVFSFEIRETDNPFDRYVIYLLGDDRPAPEMGKKAGEFNITIRQGTFGEDRLRSELLWSRKRVWEANGNVSTEVNNLTPLTIVENDIFITLCGIDGLEIEGVDVPVFENAGSYKKVKDKAQLVEFLSRLPSQWINLFYECVLVVNPKWDDKSA